MKVKHTGDYGGRRRNAYPSLAEFADAFVHERNGDPEPMKDYVARCLEVKRRIRKPKPEGSRNGNV